MAIPPIPLGLATPIISATRALAPAIGGLAGAAQLWGDKQRERLAVLESPGLTQESEREAAAFKQEMFAPILKSQQEQQQGLAQALTPAAAGGALGATARGFQGAEQRMERATEAPALKAEQKRRQLERKEEEEELRLDREKRYAKAEVLKETFALIGAAAKGAKAFETWAGDLRSDREQQGRLVKAWRLSGKEDYTAEEAQSAAKIAGVGDQLQAHTARWGEAAKPVLSPAGQPYNMRWSEGAKPAASSVPTVAAESETAAALQAIGGPESRLPGEGITNWWPDELMAPTAPPLVAAPRYASKWDVPGGPF